MCAENICERHGELMNKFCGLFAEKIRRMSLSPSPQCRTDSLPGLFAKRGRLRARESGKSLIMKEIKKRKSHCFDKITLIRICRACEVARQTWGECRVARSSGGRLRFTACGGRFFYKCAEFLNEGGQNCASHTHTLACAHNFLP